jgi:hypothetical protein
VAASIEPEEDPEEDDDPDDEEEDEDDEDDELEVDPMCVEPLDDPDDVPLPELDVEPSTSLPLFDVLCPPQLTADEATTAAPPRIKTMPRSLTGHLQPKIGGLIVN